VALAAVLTAMLVALEGPICTAALSTTYKAALMSHWIWGFIPWQQLRPEVGGVKLSLGFVMACAATGAVLLGSLLFALHPPHVASESSSRASAAASKSRLNGVWTDG